MEQTLYHSWYSYDLVRLYGFIIMFLLEAVLTIGQYGMSKGEYWIVFLTALLDIDLSHDTASMLFYGIVAVSGFVSYYRIKRYLDRSDLVERSLEYLNSKTTLILFGSFIFHVFTGDPISRAILNVCLVIVTFWIVRGILKAGRGQPSNDTTSTLPKSRRIRTQHGVIVTGSAEDIEKNRRCGYRRHFSSNDDNGDDYYDNDDEYRGYLD